MLKIFKNKYFLTHLGLSILTIILLLFLTFKLITNYTKHNVLVEVPDLLNMTPEKAINLVESQNIDVKIEIADSIFNAKKEKGVILDQLPKAGIKVKVGRKIYVTINALTPPVVEMPNLIDLSKRQAESILETYGLKVGKYIYVDGFPTVHQQMYKNKEILPGTKIEKGSAIDLVIGRGSAPEMVLLPNLIGLTKDEALIVLSTKGLSVGSVVFDASVKDSSLARIYKQFPLATTDSTKIPAGESIDFWLTEEDNKIVKKK